MIRPRVAYSSNPAIAGMVREYAELLHEQDADAFRSADADPAENAAERLARS